MSRKGLSMQRKRRFAALMGLVVALGVFATSSPSPAAAGASLLEVDDLVQLSVAGEDELRVVIPDSADLATVDIVDRRTAEVIGSAQPGGEIDVPTVMGTAVIDLVEQGGAAPRLLARASASISQTGSNLPSAAVVVTEQSTFLAWASVPSVGEWRILDGANDVLATTQSNAVTLPFTLSSVPNQIQLVGDGNIDEVLTRLVRGFAVEQHEDSGVGTASTDPATLTTTMLKYETYIPDEYADAIDTGLGIDCESGDGSDYSYGGDNRGLEYDTLKYRTLATTHHHWEEKTSSIQSFVNPTDRYIHHDDGSYEYESSRTADVGGVKVSTGPNNGFDSSGTIDHSVGNPYCSDWNTIDYDQGHTLWATGSYIVRGKHDRMPRHQVYLKYRGTDFPPLELVFHHELTDPKCLNPVYAQVYCPQWEYEYTK